MSKNIGIILSGGNGNRMKSDCPKQYMLIENKPVLYYAILAFQNSDVIDEIILVTRLSDIDYCRDEIVNKYNLSKVTHIISGGNERYESVMNGLNHVLEEGYVFIHDGARPCVDNFLLQRLWDDVQFNGAAIAAVPSKDTVKMSSEDGYVLNTPSRNQVWNIQTPQVFNTGIIKQAYEHLFETQDFLNITDDAMVVERFSDSKIHLCMGDYSNIKITTQEDLILVKMLIKKSQKNS